MSPRTRQEIQQSTPFRSETHEGVVALLLTTDRLRRFLSDAIEPHGITLQQYNVLRILRGAHPGSLLTLEVARRMIEAAPGITRLLDRLENRQLIARRQCSGDRRRVHCEITEDGLDLLASLDPVVDAANDSAFEGLGWKKVRTLIQLLGEVRESIRKVGE